MDLSEKIKSMILSGIVEENHRKIGVEIESFYYKKGSLNRLAVNNKNQYSASDLLFDINKITKNNKDEYTYSLEPGGQLEWASTPTISLWEILNEYSKNMLIQQELCANNAIDIGYFSVEPISSPLDIELINSNKYQLMHNLFKSTGKLGPWMMRNTASIQINIDYTSEQDANEMAFVADAIQPLISILFSNAPFIKGKKVNSKNLRWKIWSNTDSSRCGTLFEHNIHNQKNIINDYVEWIQSRGCIFIENPEGIFNAFDGDLGSMIATEKNPELIYSACRQIFTHVRFKKVLEVRGSDRQQKGKDILPAAFLVGLLTSKKTRDTLLDEIDSWSKKDRDDLSKCAFDLSFSNIGPKQKTIGYWLEFLSQLALDGLDERSKLYNIKNERPLLEMELKNIINNGPETLQIQNKLKKSGQTLKSFINENYLDSFE
tara:strand:+ start:844 stop:2139 length:1296 start_codon:yes stop_codon:yes gene_type:complete